MIDALKFLEDRNQIVSWLPDDFALYNKGDEDEQNFDFEIELDGHWMQLNGSIKAKRTHHSDETREQPSESTDEFTTHLYSGEIFNREGDYIRDLSHDEKEIATQTINDLL
jgi:hypothetical protein